MALLTGVFAAVLLMGLGLSLALLGSGEATLAARARDAASASYAARAAAAVGVAELRLQPSWSAVLRQGAYPELSAAPAQIVDASLTPAAPWGVTLDLRALTNQLQAETDAAGGAGDPIVWRLFAYGPMTRLVPAGPWARLYLAVWVSDDRADGDANPSADTNGSVLVHAEALGPDGARAAVEETVPRTRVLTVRTKQ